MDRFVSLNTDFLALVTGGEDEYGGGGGDTGADWGGSDASGGGDWGAGNGDASGGGDWGASDGDAGGGDWGGDESAAADESSDSSSADESPSDEGPSEDVPSDSDDAPADADAAPPEDATSDADGAPSDGQPAGEWTDAGDGYQMRERGDGLIDVRGPDGEVRTVNTNDDNPAAPLNTDAPGEAPSDGPAEATPEQMEAEREATRDEIQTALEGDASRLEQHDGDLGIPDPSGNGLSIDIASLIPTNVYGGVDVVVGPISAGVRVDLDGNVVPSVSFNTQLGLEARLVGGVYSGDPNTAMDAPTFSMPIRGPVSGAAGFDGQNGRAEISVGAGWSVQFPPGAAIPRR